MREARLQLRVDARLKQQAMKVARRRATTLSALVSAFLRELVEVDTIQCQTGTGGTEDVEQV